MDKDQKLIAKLYKEKQELKQMLYEVSSQLKDRGGFEILTEAIDDKIK